MPQHHLGGRPPLEANRYKDEIIQKLRTEGYTHAAILQWLCTEKNLKVPPRSLRRYLKNWGYQE